MKKIESEYHEKGILGCTCQDICQFMFDDAINRMKALKKALKREKALFNNIWDLYEIKK
jgi:hypothetical protein